MAKFFVGQRVRILKSNGWPELAGEEGMIVGVAEDCGIYGDSEWNVAPDCWGSDIGICPASNGALRFSPPGHFLEPILYDGAQPIAESFEEMMGKLREGVVV